MSNSLWPHGLQPARLLCRWGFSWQKYWSWLLYPPPRDIPNLGIEPRSPALQEDSLPAELPGKPLQKSRLLLLLLSHFSRVWLCATPETAAHQASASLGFSRQEHWSGLPFPSPMHESEKWKWSHSVGSGLVTFFSQCFKYFNSLSPWVQEGEVEYNLYLCSSVAKGFFLWLFSGCFLYFFIFCNLKMIRLGIGFLTFIFLANLWDSWICGLVSDINLGNCSVIIVSTIFINSFLSSPSILFHVYYTFCSCTQAWIFWIFFSVFVLFAVWFSGILLINLVAQRFFPQLCLVY